jgi:ABC-2 type transport system permease protein
MPDLSLRNIWIVARREYLERVHTRSFLLSTFVTPALLGMFMILPTMITTTTARGLMGESDRAVRLVFASDNLPLAELAAGEMTRQRGQHCDIKIDRTISEAEREVLTNQLRAGKIDGFVWIDKKALADRRLIFTTSRVADFTLQQRMRGAFNYAFAAAQLVRRGVSVDDVQVMLQGVDVRVVRVGKSSNMMSALRGTAIVLVLVFVMFFSLLTYGVMVMRSVMEEKASRITEVLLCSTSADELMAGKILGTGSVGLTQIAVWLAMSLAIASQSPYLRTMAGLLEVGPSIIVYFAIFYVLGYLLYSAIFAGVGAAFNSVDEAQQWNFVIMLPLIGASAMILPVAATPDSPVSVLISIFPFCAPVLMFERIAVHEPPAWQIALCLLLLVATIVAAFSVSARIYRVGILMYGKRPSIRELARWMRHA